MLGVCSRHVRARRAYRADGILAARRMSLREEVTELLVELLRLDTVNPPGNETLAAEALQRYFARSDIASTLIAKDPARANVVARLPGGDGPSLLLLSHTDTVIADPEEWDAIRGRATSSTAKYGVAAPST